MGGRRVSYGSYRSLVFVGKQRSPSFAIYIDIYRYRYRYIFIYIYIYIYHPVREHPSVQQLNTKLRQLRNDDKDIMWEGVNAE